MEGIVQALETALEKTLGSEINPQLPDTKTLVWLKLINEVGSQIRELTVS